MHARPKSRTDKSNIAVAHIVQKENATRMNRGRTYHEYGRHSTRRV